MRRFIEVVKPYLGVLVAIALVVPFGAGLLNLLVFDRAGERVADEVEQRDLDRALTEGVLLVRATPCAAAGIASGTAFATRLDGRPVLVTNRHVVQDVRSVGVQELDGGPGPRVESWRLAAGADVAVLDLAEDTVLPVVLGFARDEPDVGTDVVTIGFPNAMPYTTGGPIASHQGSRVQFDFRVDPGASGSPVLGPDGLVVGQIYGRTEAGHGVGTALSALRQALSDLGDPQSGC